MLRRAKEAGVVTAADMMADTYGCGFDGIKGTLGELDYFTPSYDEAAALTGEKAPERIADVLLKAGVGTAVIKLGRDGSFVKNATKAFYTRPYDVEVVDTTGAGDNFVAGFLTGVLKGWELERCADFANAAGSIAVNKLGPSGAVKSVAQVEKFIRTHHK